MTVSRAVYDAALKRVREAMMTPRISTPEKLTLAALGLDEPPTEPGDDAYVESKRVAGEREFTPQERADILARRVESPTETPKAWRNKRMNAWTGVPVSVLASIGREAEGREIPGVDVPLANGCWKCIGCGVILPRARDWNQCADCSTRDPEDYC